MSASSGMTTQSLRYCAPNRDAVLSEALIEERWYAAYTCANHEKCVAAELRARNVEHFLPLYTSVRRGRAAGKGLRWGSGRGHRSTPIPDQNPMSAFSCK